MLLGKLDIHMQRMNLYPELTLYTKINSKMDQNLNIKSQNYETFKENNKEKPL